MRLQRPRFDTPAQWPTASQPAEAAHPPARPGFEPTRGPGLSTPTRTRRGIGGTGLFGGVSFQFPDLLDVGLFYRVSDRLTVGLIGQRRVQERAAGVEGQLIDPGDLNSFVPAVSVHEETTSLSFGPFVQFRVFREQGLRPDVHLGALSLEWGTLTSATTTYDKPNLVVKADEDAASEGESADKWRSVYLAASKRLPLFRGSSIVRGVRVYGGAGYGARTGRRYTTVLTGAGDPRIRLTRKSVTRHSFVGWAGAEIALPKRISAYGEVYTGDECEFGFAAGLRWASPIGITFSVGFSDCQRPIPSRALDLIYLPGGIGGQPAVVAGGNAIDGGGPLGSGGFEEGYDYEDY